MDTLREDLNAFLLGCRAQVTSTCRQMFPTTAANKNELRVHMLCPIIIRPTILFSDRTDKRKQTRSNCYAVHVSHPVQLAFFLL
jgi:hypothetical protein